MKSVDYFDDEWITEGKNMRIEDLKYEIPTKRVDDKDFDLEKWREETPMDYLKAMYLLNMAEGVSKDIVFQEIYKITRLYIPEVLYKFFSLTDDKVLNEKKLETLLQCKIFMADAKSLNDPFDGKAYFYNANQLKKYERLAPYGGKLIDDFTEYIKITSLTGNNVNSMPMWAHYSNNHAGFCVSYDMKCNVALSSCTFPVQYCNERIDVTSLMEQQANMLFNEIQKQSTIGNKQILINDLSMVYMASLLCNLKHSSWSYENEFRCTTGAIAKGMPYIDARPKEIFIGMNCSPRYSAQLNEIANILNIPVHRMVFAENAQQIDLTVI